MLLAIIQNMRIRIILIQLVVLLAITNVFCQQKEEKIIFEDQKDKQTQYKDYFPGHNPVPMTKAVNAYLRSVKGKDNGKVIRIYEY
jgi:hypothetical protein